MTSSFDAFFEGGAKSFSFKDPSWMGKWRGGLVTAIAEPSQQTDAKTREPKFFKDGKPMLQVVITTDTTKGNFPEKDPATPDDDGVRAWYCKSDGVRAMKEAIRKAGAPIRPGGLLYFRWVSDKDVGQLSAQKIMEAVYQPPAPGADSMFAADPAPQPTAPVQQPGFANAPLTASEAPAAPPGVDPAQWAAFQASQAPAGPAPAYNPQTGANPFSPQG